MQSSYAFFGVGSLGPLDLSSLKGVMLLCNCVILILVEVSFLRAGAGGSPAKSMDHNWLFVVVVGIISRKPLQAREVWEHR